MGSGKPEAPVGSGKPEAPVGSGRHSAAHLRHRARRTFQFAQDWQLPGPPDAVFALLADPDGYPQWWPQVRRVARTGEFTGHAWVRSVLPVTLKLDLTRDVVDPVGGRLRVRIDGDLIGWAAWTIGSDGSATRAHFTQEVVLAHRWLGHVAGLAGPVLRANHNAMMRAGERGLGRHLARHTP